MMMTGLVQNVCGSLKGFLKGAWWSLDQMWRVWIMNQDGGQLSPPTIVGSCSEYLRSCHTLHFPSTFLETSGEHVSPKQSVQQQRTHITHKQVWMDSVLTDCSSDWMEKSGLWRHDLCWGSQVKTKWSFFNTNVLPSFDKWQISLLQWQIKAAK